MGRLRWVMLWVALGLVVSCGKDKGGSGASGGAGMSAARRPEPRRESPVTAADRKVCHPLADRAASCGPPKSAAFRGRMTMRACLRDIRNPATRKMQERLNACAQETDCKRFLACHDKASAPLRDYYYKKHSKKRRRN